MEGYFPRQIRGVTRWRGKAVLVWKGELVSLGDLVKKGISKISRDIFNEMEKGRAITLDASERRSGILQVL